MITPKAFRIGNYFNYNNKSHEVILTRDKYFKSRELNIKPNTFVEHAHTDTTDYINCSYIEITKEELIKLGGVEDGFKSINFDISVHQLGDRIFSFSGDYLYMRQKNGPGETDDLITIWNKDIKKKFYVHEFQNLFHSLTQAELKYNDRIKN